ncbi:MAG: transposase [Clostridiales bacterium]|nr:transposase [Clostridiales bacterium]
MQYTVVKIRLYPTPEQTALLEKTFGCCRFLWNRMLEDVQTFYAATDIHYIPTPAHYKAEAPFLKEVDSQSLCAVHQNLRKAFLDFFRDPKTYQYPGFKTKKSRKDSFTVYCRPYRTGPSIRLADDGIQMPKLGLVKAKVHRKPLHWWSLRFVTVSKTKSGKYFCSVAFGYEAAIPERTIPKKEKTLGLNFSLTRFYVDSEGDSPKLPALAKSKEKLRRMQQKLSRMVCGSKNYWEQLQKIRLLHERMANQRTDFLHKESRRIANAYDAVCVRKTDLRELSQKLTQGGVLDLGFGRFRELLRYKLERQGKSFILVDGYSPAAKVCSVCGSVNDGLDAHEKSWSCPSCGAALSRGDNTAKNLQAFGLAQFYSKQTLGANAR